MWTISRLDPLPESRLLPSPPLVSSCQPCISSPRAFRDRFPTSAGSDSSWAELGAKIESPRNESKHLPAYSVFDRYCLICLIKCNTNAKFGFF